MRSFALRWVFRPTENILSLWLGPVFIRVHLCPSVVAPFLLRNSVLMKSADSRAFELQRTSERRGREIRLRRSTAKLFTDIGRSGRRRVPGGAFGAQHDSRE